MAIEETLGLSGHSGLRSLRIATDITPYHSNGVYGPEATRYSPKSRINDRLVKILASGLLSATTQRNSLALEIPTYTSVSLSSQRGGTKRMTPADSKPLYDATVDTRIALLEESCAMGESLIDRGRGMSAAQSLD
jgi:hypothetical protein